MMFRRGMKKSVRSESVMRAAATGAVEVLEGRVLLAGSGLAGAYFNNANLSGTAAGTRIDKTVNFVWSGTPGVSGVGADNFSVRWTGQVNPRYTGAYTFLTNSDDGVRLFINGTKIIDNWTRHGATVNTGTANLTAGVKANVTMEFFDSSGGATAQLMWQSKSQAKEIIPESQLSNTYTPPTTPPAQPPPSGTGDGLLGTYFDNMDFTAQKFARVDPQVSFNWGTGSPASSVQADTFSVRWTGQVLAAKSETYTFYTNSDDGARLTVNGKVLIDKLIPQGPTEYAGSIALVAGQRYNIQLDYMERSGGAQVAMSWSSPSTAKQVIPKAQLYSSAVVTPPPTEKPAAPAGLTATAVSSSQIRLDWQDLTNETSYKLERSADGSTGWTQIATPAANATTYTDGGLAAGTQYYYRLRATNSAGDGVYTAVVNGTAQAVTPPTETPATPGGFAATTVSASQIRLNWQDVSNETSYKLERSADGATGWTQIAAPAANATSYTDSSLAASTKYFYRLRASNSVGDSVYTAVVNATTQAVTPPPAGKYQPDQTIRVHRETTFVGDNVYNATGDAQSKSATGDFYTTVFEMRVYNDGDTADSFVITGPAGDKDWRVSYYDSLNFGWDGGKTITAAVTGVGWNTGVIQPGGFKDYRMEVLALAAPGGTSRTFTATARSNADASKVDVVTGTVNNPVVRALSWRRQNFDPGGTYLMKIENQGNQPDQFTINTNLAAGFGSTWNVQFFDDQWGGNDITAAVRSGGGWRTPVLQPYESQEFRVVFSGYTDPTAAGVQLTAASVGKTDVRETLPVTIPAAEDRPAPTDVFPIGTWTQPVSSFDKWKSRGVNTLIEYQGDGATIEQWSQAARDRGMYYIRQPLSNPALDVGDKNLLAWALPDEPEITTKYPPATLTSWVDGWKQADPNRPIWANFSGGYVLRWQGNVAGPSGYAPYQNLLDWDSSSIYPVTGWYRPEEHPGLDAPGRSLDQLEKWSNGHPQFAVIEPSDQELNWIQKDIPGPTPGQFRAEVWDSIIHGARGVIYFPMSFKPSFRFDNTSPEVAAEMTTTDAKIQSIARVLQSDIDPATRGFEASSPLEGTWRVVDGKTYYVVLNFSNQAVTGTMTLQGIGDAALATVNGEGRSVPLVNGTFSDTFGAYSVHVYEVAAPAGVTEAAAPTVAAASAEAPVVRSLAPVPAPAFAVTPRIRVSSVLGKQDDRASFDERVGI